MNGMEIYTTCIGTHTVVGNMFLSNSMNGLFVGSGTTNATNNTFQSNRNGLVVYSNTTVGTDLSVTDTK